MRGQLAIFALIGTAIVMAILVVVSRREAMPRIVMPSTALQQAALRLPADRCVTCHHRQTPAIVEQWAHSVHARNRTTCRDCHEVSKSYPTAQEHFGSFISAAVTPGTCGTCHPKQAMQFSLSRHGLPAWTALVGYDALDPEFQKQFDRINEIRHAPGGGELPVGFVGATRNALFDIEGPAVTKMACQSCHQIGRPNADGTAGNCNECHLRHEFSIEQVRKPETCSHCHIGPDHPQFEIFNESAHGILYHTKGHEYNWSQISGRLGVEDFQAATCQVCHMSGFGPQATTHDVGDRLSWYLFAEISTHRPNWNENRERMKTVCTECHSRPFVDEDYKNADNLTEAVNQRVGEAKRIVESLVSDGLMTAEPFDDPLKFTAFDLWHHYGRTAKFGAWMQGPDYTQWHGIYPLLSKLAELKKGAHALRAGRSASSQPASTE